MERLLKGVSKKIIELQKNSLFKRLFEIFQRAYQILVDMKLRNKLILIYSSLFISVSCFAFIMLFFNMRGILIDRMKIHLRGENYTIYGMIEITMKEGMKNYLRSKNDTILGFVKMLNDDVLHGRMEEMHAKKIALDAIGGLQQKGLEYTYVVNSSGVVLEHIVKDYIGKNMMHVDVVSKSIKQKNGYIEYEWKNPDENVVYKKAAYANTFKNWDWTLGTVFYKTKTIEILERAGVKDLIKKARFGESEYSYILDKNGVILIHPKLSDEQVGKYGSFGPSFMKMVKDRQEGTVEYNWKNDWNDKKEPFKRKIAHYRYLPDLEWFVVTAAYEDVYVKDLLINLVRPLFYFVLVIVFFVVFVSFVFSRSIVGHINLIVSRLKSSSSAGLLDKIPVKRKDELGAISNYFNQFIDKVNDYNNKILAEIGDRIEIEKRLELSEKKFSKIFYSNPDPILLINLSDRQVIDVNTSASVVFEYLDCELIDKSLYEIVLWKDEKALESFFDIISSLGQIRNYETVFVKKSGEVFVSLVSAELVDINSKKSIVIIAKDISELKKIENERVEMQKQVFQASKMASLGEMASSVAHELNNPLTGVLGFAQLLKKKSVDKPEIVDKLDKIIHSSTRMKGIVDHLRRFSRKSNKKDWTSLEVSTPIKNAVELLEGQLKQRDIECSLSVCENLGKIWGDSNQLESVFQNFISNSRDAFDSLVDIERHKIIRVTIQNVIGGVKVIYSDNAGGMTQEVADKLFDPFFTTKEAGKGTGLGMSIVRGVIDEHRGTISFSTRLGDGTVFELFFPEDRRKNRALVSDASGYISKSHDQLEAVPKHMPRVLVVDDEQLICDLLGEFLKDDFDTKFLRDSEIASREIQMTKYDIIITDLTMPGVSGTGLIFAAKTYQPGTPVIVTTGYSTDDISVKNALKNGACDVLTKPFSSLDDVVSLIKKYC